MDLTLLLPDPTLGAVIDVVKGFVFVIFVLSAIVLTTVILLQEGKGGGLGGAFGGAAADTFGVKAGSVNRFTTYVAAAFLGLALLYAGISAAGEKKPIELKESSVELTPPPEIRPPGDTTPVELPPDDGGDEGGGGSGN